jgi:hypothetical protein
VFLRLGWLVAAAAALFARDVAEHFLDVAAAAGPRRPATLLTMNGSAHVQLLEAQSLVAEKGFAQITRRRKMCMTRILAANLWLSPA